MIQKAVQAFETENRHALNFSHGGGNTPQANHGLNGFAENTTQPVGEYDD